MRSAYLDYAMSVIVGRALPDVRDGLKPVHRRVLHVMNELGLQPNRKHVKCAQIVGEVMGKFHPARRHGDLRHARPHGAGLLHALPAGRRPRQLRQHRRLGRGRHALHRGAPGAPGHRDAAGHRRRRPSTSRPPTTGRARSPSCSRPASRTCSSTAAPGIAVGMATNIPPHNLREVVAATIAYIDDPQIDVEGLMRHIKGPDFPTAGTILGREGIRDAYATGRGRVRVQAKAHIEPIGQGKEAIIVTELPFQVRKGGDGGLIEKIARPRPRQEDPGDHRRPGRVRPARHAPRDRAQARRDPEGRPQQAAQAHPDADHVRRQHGRPRRQRAPHAVAARGHRPLRRPSARGHRSPHQVRAAPLRGARARAGGAAHRAGQPRRGDRAHPRVA